MTTFYLVRHGKTDYSEIGTKVYHGYGINLSPLSEKGIRKIYKTAKCKKLKKCDIILSSPYTRALQSAAILSKELKIDIAVETELHEWLANKNYGEFISGPFADRYYDEYVELNGKYPEGELRRWETRESMRNRLISVLEKYSHLKKVIVVCHGMIIQSLIGGDMIKTAEFVEFSGKNLDRFNEK